MSEPPHRVAHSWGRVRRHFVTAVFAVGSLIAGCFGPVPTTDAPCPCAAGFRCCEASNVCREPGTACPVAASDAGGSDAGAVDAGLANRLFVTAGTYTPGTLGDGDERHPWRLRRRGLLPRRRPLALPDGLLTQRPPLPNRSTSVPYFAR